MNRIDAAPRAFILSAAEHLPADQKVWGTGGWVPPDQREALDWIVLVRMLGWRAIPVDVADVAARLPTLTSSDTIVLACDPVKIPESTASLLESLLDRLPTTLIFRKSSRAAGDVPPLFACSSEDRISGRRIVWQGGTPAKRWNCRRPIDAFRLPANATTRTLATLDGHAVISEQNHASGRRIQLGFHPSAASDQGGECVGLLRQLMTFHPIHSRAWYDWSGTMVLRIDDPGGAQNVYSRNWCYQELDRPAWSRIGRELAARDARLSIGYVSGWVDDGDARRGTLWLDGKVARRRAGAIHPSPRVHYQDHQGHRPGTESDYESEYRGIRDLCGKGLTDIELHGFTHLHPDLQAWLVAPDRYDERGWFRDFSPSASSCLAKLAPEQHPICRGMRWIEAFFQTRPVCLISPGDEWTNEVLEQALRSQLQLVSSYYLAIRQDDRFLWSTHICAPYLDEPASHWFASGLPVIGYFHDYELATEGVDWLARNLDQWREAGARRFIDFREVAAALATELSLERENNELTLRLHPESGSAPWPRPIPVKLRIHGGNLPGFVTCRRGDEERIATVQQESAREGRVLVPVF
jgi:hypothetical protein